MATEHLVFVYGTLREGEGHHGLLARARPAGEASTPPTYELCDLGGFPGLVTGGKTAVRGELYSVDDVTLDRLDDLEGHPRYLKRETILLDDNRRVLAYLLPRSEARGCPRIATGDWCRREAVKTTRELSSAD